MSSAAGRADFGRDLVTATVRFGRLLRARGLPVTPAQSQDALRALELVDLGDRAEVWRALRAVLASRAEELHPFDAAFDAFWGAPGDGARAEAEAPIGGEAPFAGSRLPPAPGGAPHFAGWTEAAKGGGEPVGLPAVSDIETASGKDFAAFAPGELAELERLAAGFARRLAMRRGRRLKPSQRRGRVDLRRSLRRGLPRGELLELLRRERKRVKTKLVVLCDVSGSMDLYSRLLLQFLYALQGQHGRVETFVFSTRLERITEALRSGGYGEALGRLSAVAGWSGGTKIGESLRAFHADWRGLLDRDTVVVVLSDGWDTGDPAVLDEALRVIRRSAGRLIWLNPLLGSPDYQPLAQGMAAALPHLDAFLPAHDLDALRGLARHLGP
jgi:uncharacterized protein with von Willebrand factor type A (vWA) domain